LSSSKISSSSISGITSNVVAALLVLTISIPSDDAATDYACLDSAEAFFIAESIISKLFSAERESNLFTRVTDFKLSEEVTELEIVEVMNMAKFLVE
jgi:hypothetical protein